MALLTLKIIHIIYRIALVSPFITKQQKLVEKKVILILHCFVDYYFFKSENIFYGICKPSDEKKHLSR